MSNRPPSWATLVVETHRMSADVAALEHVVGYALLKVTKLSRDQWCFALDSFVSATLDDEPELITRLADQLPRPMFLIGTNIESDIIERLRRAAERMPEPQRAFATLRIAILQSACQVDLAIGTARPKAPLPYAEPAVASKPITITVAGDTIVDVARARTEIEQRAVDQWLQFLRAKVTTSSSVGNGTAGIATMTWMVSRGFA